MIGAIVIHPVSYPSLAVEISEFFSGELVFPETINLRNPETGFLSKNFESKIGRSSLLFLKYFPLIKSLNFSR
jgi:hypothetical protein